MTLRSLIVTVLNSSRLLVAAAAFGSAAILVGALIFQALGYAPCHLCILQRWPHLVAAILGVAILIFRLPMVTALLGALAALVTAGMGIYHSLVERHLIAGPDTCTAAPVGSMSASDLLAHIQNSPVIRCDEIAWQMFGVTMPNLNALFSLVFAALWLRAFWLARR
ncbi:disulfide bond formation protein B [Paenirhodobacter populi]|uniref:disulfide bond formation protein B n=1 Tax=Paenirhodobacter populi TaxID=2306993 RepID=UPI001F4DD2AE|nr:disulfide bond formation protein B [Sinirhodobacter populi]